MKARNITIGLMACMYMLTGGFVYAQSAIDLSSLKKETINGQTNYSGVCGTSEVKIMDVEELNSDIFKVNNGKLTVKSEKKVLILNDLLSDYNGIACVKTKVGERLLVWSNCSGSVCGEDFNFFVIDPKKLTIIAPKKGKICDDKCASKILGSKLPQKINRR